MNVRLEQLESHLQQGLKAIYIVSGDEPLQAQEACQLIRAAAKAAQFNEHEILTVDSRFKWDELLTAGNALSLFAAQKLIELRIANGKPGTEGSKALQHYVQTLSDNNLLLINSGKFDKSAKNSKWYKSLISKAVHIEIWPIESQQLPNWISRRMRQAGLEPDQQAAPLLAELVDGNLLAASQEIEKLKLLLPDDNPLVSAQTIQDSIVDSARYSAFNLVDAALKGNSKECVKMLSGLHDEGVEPLSLTWVLGREIRQLSLIKQAVQQGRPAEQAMQAQGVWRNRQPLVSKALSRLSAPQLSLALQKIAHADQLAKGMHRGNIWDQLEDITLTLAGVHLGR
jgi:DNA polymerase III subunit delta